MKYRLWFAFSGGFVGVLGLVFLLKDDTEDLAISLLIASLILFFIYLRLSSNPKDNESVDLRQIRAIKMGTPRKGAERGRKTTR